MTVARPKTYFPYHIHTMLSNGVTDIDSITDFHDYIDLAEKDGIKNFAFSEHGSIFNWLKKKEYIESKGMKYVHAIEAYITNDSNLHKNLVYSATSAYPVYDKKTNKIKKFDSVKVEYQESKEQMFGNEVRLMAKPTKIFSKKEVPTFNGWLPIDKKTIKTERLIKTRDNYHCVLLAKNYEGVKELNRLVSKSFNRDPMDVHFYYMPRITFDELFETSDNILITTACLGGALHNGTPEVIEKFLAFLVKNKHRCFLEIQHHNCEEQIEYNRMLYKLSLDTGIPLVTGTDSHALNQDHMAGRAMLQAAKGVSFPNEDDWDLVFKTTDELIKAYEKQGSLAMSVVYEAINNTVKMADMVEEFTVDKKPKYPKLYSNPDEVFKKKINEGVIRRGINKYPNYQAYKDRIHEEYATYKHNDAVDFMLLEEDYKRELRNQGVRFGYSRGSVSGSIIAYLLGITEIDSVKYNLNFSRFMNPERISLADYDIIVVYSSNVINYQMVNCITHRCATYA